MTITASQLTFVRRLTLALFTAAMVLSNQSSAQATALSYELADDMDAFWDFNGASPLADKSGNGNTLVAIGDPVFAAPTASNNGWSPSELTGSAQVAVLDSDDGFILPGGLYANGSFTFVVAGSQPRDAFATILSGSNGTDSFRYQKRGGEEHSFETEFGGGTQIGSTVTLDDWYVYALTYDVGTDALTGYVMTNTGTFAASDFSGTQNIDAFSLDEFHLGLNTVGGAIGGADAWEGELDFAVFNNTALSSGELQSLLNDFVNGPTTPEPTTGLMVLVGICALATRRRRRLLGKAVAMLLICIALPLANQAEAGVVGYWNFDGQNANDGLGISNGVEVGGPTYSTDVAAETGGGYSLSVDGTNRVTVAHTAQLLVNDTMTILYRLKADNGVQPGGFTRPISRGGANPAWEFQRDGTASSLSPRIDTSASSNQTGPSIATVFDNNWHQIAFRADNGSRTTFRDGVLGTTNAYSHGAGFGTTNTLGIGATGGGGNAMNGLIDDVQIWDEALSDGKVIALYDPILGFNPSQMESLFDVFDTGTPALVGGGVWRTTSGLSLGLGQSAVLNDGRLLVVQLDALGNGVLAAIPEPSTALLLGVGLIGICASRRRRLNNQLAAVLLGCCVLASGGIANAALVGFYDFNADNAIDGSGNGNNGAVDSAVAFGSDTPSGSGRSVVFAGGGGNGQITVANSASLQVDDTMTLSFWIKAPVSATNYQRIIRKGNEAGGQNSLIVTQNALTNDMLIRYDAAAGGGGFNQNRHAGVGNELDNTWHQVTFVADNGSTKEFVDGVLIDTTTYSHGTGFGNTLPLEFNNQGSFNGLMDDVALWDTALNNGMAATLFSQPFGLTQPDLSPIFDAFNNPGTVTFSAGRPWRQVSGLALGEGNSAIVNGVQFVIQLDALGNGVIGFIPEPTTGLMVIVGVCGLAMRRRRSVAKVSAAALACMMLFSIGNNAHATALTYEYASQVDHFWDFEGASPLVSKSGAGATLTNGGTVTFGSATASSNGWNPQELNGGTVAQFADGGSDYLSMPAGSYTGGDFTFVVAGRRPASETGWTTILANTRFQLMQIQGEPNPYLNGRANGDSSFGGSVGASALPEDEWYLMAYTYDNTSQELNAYAVTNTGTMAGPLFTDTLTVSLSDATNFRIGRDGVSTPALGGPDGWNGQLDFIIFDNSVLTAGNLQGLLNDFNNGPSTPEPTTGLMVVAGICGLVARRRRHS